MQILCRAVVTPKKAIILGADWKLSVIEGALEKDFVKDLKSNGAFDEASFEREYSSVWAGDIENAFFDSEKFDKQRILNLAEKKYNEKLQGDDYYVMGVDVGRIGLIAGPIKISLIAGTSAVCGQSAAKGERDLCVSQGSTTSALARRIKQSETGESLLQ